MKPVKQDIPCPVCDSYSYKVLYEPWVEVQDPVNLYGATSGIQGTQRLVTCLDCGLIYENPRLSQDVILQGYCAYDQVTHDSQHAMRVESFFRALLAVKEHIPPKGASILDVGTASGAFLEAAQKFGYRAVGLEPSTFMVQQGVQRGLDIRHGTLADHPFEEQFFDMVCLWDVLEHVPDPKIDLLQMKKLLKPNGILLINYPDIGTWMAKLAGRRFWWLLSVHLLHFSRQSMQNICVLTGFTVFHFQPYWQILQFGYLESMAMHLQLPMSGQIKKLTPQGIQRIPIPYYASQTTALARINSVHI